MYRNHCVTACIGRTEGGGRAVDENEKHKTVNQVSSSFQKKCKIAFFSKDKHPFLFIVQSALFGK